jgi:predicted ATPase
VLQRLEITNYRSIASAVVDLRPFTILVGANGSGKSNLLKLLRDLCDQRRFGNTQHLAKHLQMQGAPTRVKIIQDGGARAIDENVRARVPELDAVRVFTIDPNPIG